jgi:quercetin dioxygenase-like cupin family protein
VREKETVVKTITAEHVAVADNPHGVDVRHLYSTADVVVSQITLEPGEIVKPHQAPVDAFFYVLEGAPRVEVDGEATVGEPGMLIPSAKGRRHSIRNESDARVRFLVVKTPNPKA